MIREPKMTKGELQLLALQIWAKVLAGVDEETAKESVRILQEFLGHMAPGEYERLHKSLTGDKRHDLELIDRAFRKLGL